MTVIKKDFDILLSAVFALICFTLNLKKKRIFNFFFRFKLKIELSSFYGLECYSAMAMFYKQYQYAKDPHSLMQIYWHKLKFGNLYIQSMYLFLYQFHLYKHFKQTDYDHDLSTFVLNS